MTVDIIGWIATAIFAGSYLCKDPRKLRWVQALAACLWMAYGAVIGAAPVLVANLLVACFAVWSSFRPLAARKLPDPSRA
ncbi:MAG: YgjV family protein [Gemmatimonadales bacterium]